MSQSSAIVDVLVVGAGPVGLTLANLLVSMGVRCRIITKEAYLRPVSESRAEGVHIRTLHLLEQLGVLEQAFSQGRPIHGATLHANGRVLGSFGLNDPQTPFFPGALILEQGKVERILADRFTTHGIALERGVELIDLQQEPDRVIATLKLADGQTSQTSARYVVGCDGAHSKVRHLIGASFEGTAHPGQYALADVQLNWYDQPYDDNLHIFLSPMLVLGRLAEGSWKIAAPLLSPIKLGEESETDFVLATLQQQMDRHKIPATLHSPRWTSLFRISTRMVNQMRDRRVFLAGDAAHIHSPMGGQGMNEGMQDALNLAWKLAIVLQRGAGDDLLDTYHAERHPSIAEVLHDTQRMTQLVEVQNPAIGHLRNAVLATAMHLEPIQTAMRLQFTGSRRALGTSDKAYSPFTHTLPFAGGPEVGHRAPDAQDIVIAGNPGKRLFQIWAEEPHPFCHRLLLFVGERSDIKQGTELSKLARQIEEQWGRVLRSYLIYSGDVAIAEALLQEIPTALKDVSGELHQRYSARTECLYLIRPDGFVGFRSQGIDVQLLQAFLYHMGLN